VLCVTNVSRSAVAISLSSLREDFNDISDKKFLDSVWRERAAGDL